MAGADVRVDPKSGLLMRAPAGRRGRGEVLEWSTGGHYYGAVVKAVPVESVVLVRAIEASASGPDKAKYTFSIKELTEAADR